MRIRITLMRTRFRLSTSADPDPDPAPRQSDANLCPLVCASSSLSVYASIVICECPGLSSASSWAFKVNFDFNEDQIQFFHSNADADPASQNNAGPKSQPWLGYRKTAFDILISRQQEEGFSYVTRVPFLSEVIEFFIFFLGYDYERMSWVRIPSVNPGRAQTLITSVGKATSPIKDDNFRIFKKGPSSQCRSALVVLD